MMNKNSIFYATGISGLENGSFYRLDSPKAKRAAQYINGDYMGQFLLIAPDLTPFTRDEARKHLPKCCGGK